jgi:hypothetical protein
MNRSSRALVKFLAQTVKSRKDAERARQLNQDYYTHDYKLRQDKDLSEKLLDLKKLKHDK